MSTISSGQYTGNSYTNLDYNTLYEQLQNHFQNDPDSPFKDFNFTGSNLTQLLKILSYVSHLSLFHTSMALNEMYFSTSRLRKNLVKQLSAYGYSPRRMTASHKYLTLKNNSDYDIVINEFTQFNATGAESLSEKVFYTLESFTIPANGTELITVYQSSSPNGRVIQTLDIFKDNDILEEINLDIENLSQQYFIVQTVENGEIVSWVQYEDLDTLQNQLDNSELTLLPEQNIYFLDESENGYILKFSTTGIGAVPNPDDGKTLTIKYMECDGTESNGFSTSLFSFATEIANLEILQDSNILAQDSIGVSSGGQNKETLNELRENVIASFNTQNRGVTEYDYTKLGRANELIGESGNIQVYGGEKHVSAKRLGKVFIVAFPAIAEQYFFSDAEKLELEAYFKKYNITGITPIVQNPHYINSIIDYNFIFKALISDTAAITDELISIIKNYFLSNFGETIYVPKLIEQINKVFGVESAYIKNRYKIIFDTLENLDGTYKLVPLTSVEAEQFINSDGSFYTGYVFGFTDEPTYFGSNYGELIAVNVDGGYLIVKQSSGVNNTNFENFSKAPTVASYKTRKDLLNVDYDVIPDTNYLYLTNTDGFNIDDDVVSLGTAGISTATINSIDKKSLGKKYCDIQLNSTINGTNIITVNSNIVNTGSIVGKVLEVTGTTNLFVYYINGSDFAEGQTIDIGTTYSTAKFQIAKREQLNISSLINGSSSGGTGLIIVGNSVINSLNILGTVETLGTYAGAGSAYLSVWFSSGTNYIANTVLEIGTSWTGGTGTNPKVTLLSLGTLSYGVGPVTYRAYVTDVSAIPFETGTANIEPGATWKFNRIASIGASTNTITVTDPLYGLLEGDSLCNSGNALTTTILEIVGNTITVEDGTGFVVGQLVHSGNNWSGVLSANIYKIGSVYDLDKPLHLTVDNAFYLGSAQYLVQSSGNAQITEIGTSVTLLGSTSNIVITIANATGTFELGLNNIIGSDTVTYEPLYTLNGNIEDFSTNYILQYDETDALRYFINKLDFSDSGMLDATPTLISGLGYSLIFNTTQYLDRNNIVVKLTYGTNAEVTLSTQQNTKYEAELLVNDTIYQSNGSTALAVSDYITIHAGPISNLYAYVYGINTENGNYKITVRYDSNTFVMPYGSGNSLHLMYVIQYGSQGYTWNGSSATNSVIEVISERVSPSTIIYYSDASGTSDFFARINLTTGDVAVKRALSTTARIINSGTTNITSVDFTNRRLYFTDTSDFLKTGGTTSYILTIWNSDNYDWESWEYTDNQFSVNPPYLESINNIPETITENMLAIQDTENLLKRVEFDFKNQVDKLKLGNRALFYSSTDLINPLQLI